MSFNTQGLDSGAGVAPLDLSVPVAGGPAGVALPVVRDSDAYSPFREVEARELPGRERAQVSESLGQGRAVSSPAYCDLLGKVSGDETLGRDLKSALGRVNLVEEGGFGSDELYERVNELEGDARLVHIVARSSNPLERGGLKEFVKEAKRAISTGIASMREEMHESGYSWNTARTELFGIMQTSLVEKMLPDLCKSLFTDTSWPKALALSPVEFFRRGVVSDLKKFEDGLSSMLPDVGARELLELDEDALVEKIEAYLFSQIEFTFNHLINRAMRVSETLSPCLTNMARQTFLAFQGKSDGILLEFSRDHRGICLKVITSDEAYLYHLGEYFDRDLCKKVIDLPKDESDTPLKFFGRLKKFIGVEKEFAKHLPAKESLAMRYTAHRNSFRGGGFALFDFNVKVEAIHNLWGHLLAKPDDLFLHADELLAALDVALKKGVELCKMKAVSDGDLRKLHALSCEIREKIEKERQNGSGMITLPKKVVSAFDTLFQSISPTDAAWVENLLVGIFGEGVAEITDFYMRQVGLKSTEAPVYHIDWGRFAKEQVIAFSRAFVDVSIEDIKNPSVTSMVKVGLSVARIALLIFFYPVVLPTLVALGVTNVVWNCVWAGLRVKSPKTVQDYERWKAKTLGQVIAYFQVSRLFSEEQIKALEEMERYFRALVGRGEELDFSRVPQLTGNRVHHRLSVHSEEIAGEVDTIGKFRIDQHSLSIYDGIYEIPITTPRELEKAFAFAAKIDHSGEKTAGDIKALNDLVSRLPPLDHEVWLQVDPKKVITHLVDIGWMYQGVMREMQPFQRHRIFRSEMFIAASYLYALTDKLVRLLGDSLVEDEDEPNRVVMAVMKDHIDLVVTRRMENRFADVLKYFRLERERRYSVDEVEKIDERSLFSEKERGKGVTILFATFGKVPKYYRRMLDQEDVKEKLRSGPKRSPLEKLKYVYDDESDILPKSFRQLRDVNDTYLGCAIAFNNAKRNIRLDRYKMDGEGPASLPVPFMKNSDGSPKQVTLFQSVTNVESDWNGICRNRRRGNFPFADLPNEKFGETLVLDHAAHSPRSTVGKYVALRWKNEAFQAALLTIDPQDRAARLMGYLLDDLSILQSNKKAEGPQKLLSDTLDFYLQMLSQGNCVALQLECEGEFAKTIEDFFFQCVGYLEEFDDTIALFHFVQVMLNIEQQIGHSVVDIDAYLVDLHRRKYRSDKEITYKINYLRLFPLFFISPERVSKEERYRAYEKISKPLTLKDAKLAFTYTRQWQRALFKGINEDFDLRDQMLSRLAEAPEGTHWCGAFPHYRSSYGNYTVGISSVVDHFVHVKKHATEKAHEFFGSDVGEAIQDDFCVRFPRCGLIASFSETPRGAEMTFAIENEQGRFEQIDMNESGEGVSHWINRDKRILQARKDGKVFAEYPLEIDGEAISVAKGEFTRHGGELFRLGDNEQLSLHFPQLAWFSPSHTIQYLRSIADGMPLKKIVIADLDLEFDLKDTPNGKKAFLAEAPGYFIAKSQNPVDYPELAGVTRFLVLENADGKRKVLLPEDGIGISAARVTDLVKMPDFVAGLVAPLVGDKWMIGKSKCHLCAISSRDGMTSNEPEAVFFLFLQAYYRSDFEKMRALLTTFRVMGKRQKFSPELIQRLETFELMAFASTRPGIEAVVYKLSVIREENLLVHKHQALDIAGYENELSMIMFIVMNYHYQKGSDRTDRYGDFLFLRGVIRRVETLVEIYRDELGIPESIFGLSVKKMRQMMLRVVLCPEMLDEYQELASKYGSLAEREEIKSVEVIDKFFARLTREGGGVEKMISTMSGVITELESEDPEIASKTAKTLGILVDSSKYTEWSDEIPLELSSYTFTKLYEYFPLYYRLARSKPKPGMPQGKEFKKAREKLGKILTYLTDKKGSGVQETALLKALHSAYFSEDQTKFPSTKEFDRLVKESIEIYQNPQKIDDSRVEVFEADRAEWVKKYVSAMAPSAISMGMTIAGASARVVADGALSFATASFQRFARFFETPQVEQEADRERVDLRSECEVAALQTVDEAYASLLQGLVNQNFESSEVEREQSVTRFSRDDAAYAQLNTSLDEYEKRDLGKRYRLKNTDELRASASAIRAQLAANMREYREEITTILQAEESGAMSAIALAEAAIGSDVRKARHALQDRFADLLTKFGRMEKIGVELETLLYKYLIASTRLQQIDQALEQTDETMMAKELRGDRRHYKIDGVPEHLMRIFLLLEHSTGSMLWKEQVEQNHKLLTSEMRRQVNQQPTGSGKTAVGIPVAGAYASRDGEILYNFFYDPVAQTQIGETGDRSAHAFGREGAHFSVSRIDEPSIEQLDAWITMIHRAIERGETLNGIKLDMQTLELLMIEEATVGAPGNVVLSTDEQNGKLMRYIEILRLLKTHVIANVDEAHLLLRRTRELNHPLAHPELIREDEKLIVLECVSVLAGALAPSEDYNDHKDRLIDHFVRYFKVPESDQATFREYLGDMSKSPSRFVRHHEKKSLIALARGMICRIIPEVTPQRVGKSDRRPLPNVDYGRSVESADHEFAKPYQGNNNPMEDSRIKNVHEATLKTAFLYLHNGLDKEQVIKLHEKMREFAQVERDKRGTPLQETSMATHMERWCGKKDAITRKKLTDAEIEQIRFAPGAVLSYVHHFIDIESYPSSVKSTAQNFASMFRGVYGMTASPDLPGTFPTGTEMLWYPGTAGEFVNFVCTTCEKVEEIAPKKPEELLDEILGTYSDPQMRSIIDGGAFFEGMSNEKVARRIAQICRSEIGGVVYFEGEIPMILEIGHDVPIKLESSQVPVEKRFVYFDDAHTTAADVKQSDDVRAVVTVGPKTNLQQAVGRLRRRHLGQRVTLLRQSGTLQNVTEPRALVELLEKESYEASRKENYLSAFDQIANLQRRAIINEMMMAKDADAVRKIGAKYRKTLRQSGAGDIYDIYGGAQEMIPFADALAKEKRAVRGDALRRGVESIGTDPRYPYPARVPSHKTSDDLGMSQQLAVRVSVQQRQNVQTQQKQQVDASQFDNERIGGKQNPKLDDATMKWPPIEDCFHSMKWLQAAENESGIGKSVKFYAADERMYATRGLEPLTGKFGENMFFSSNAIGIDKGFFSSSLAPLTANYRKPIYHLLVVSDGGTIKTIALDQNEARLWKNRLKNAPQTDVKIGLFDLTLHTFTAQSPNRYSNDDLTDNFWFDVAKWQFLTGHGRARHTTEKSDRMNTIFSRFATWLLADDYAFMRRVFYTFKKSMSPTHFRTVSDIDRILSPEALENNSFI